MSGTLRVLPADTPRLHARSLRPAARLRLARCDSMTRAASAAFTTRPSDPSRHPLLARLAPGALRPEVRCGLPVADHAPAAGVDQAGADEQPARRRRGQHLRERDALSGADQTAAAGAEPVAGGGRAAGEGGARRAVPVRSSSAGPRLRDYVGADGAPGYFRQRLYVYERKECRACGTCDPAADPTGKVELLLSRHASSEGAPARSFRLAMLLELRFHDRMDELADVASQHRDLPHQRR